MTINSEFRFMLYEETFIGLFIHFGKTEFANLDLEFGRLQARDILQHLWSGPISNASVDVVQGGRSVEVRAVGVTKVNLCWLAASVSCLCNYQWSYFFCSLLNFHIYQQGAAIDRILGEIVRHKGLKTPIDYVLCIGHFLQKVCFSWLTTYEQLSFIRNTVLCMF